MAHASRVLAPIVRVLYKKNKASQIADFAPGAQLTMSTCWSFIVEQNLVVGISAVIPVEFYHSVGIHDMPRDFYVKM